MAGNNDAVFNYAAQVVTDEILTQASRDVVDIRDTLQNRVKDFSEAFYAEMLFEGRYSGDRGLPLYSKYYAPLQDTYRKGHSRFLEDSGELMDSLLSRNPSRDLGAPEVKFQKGPGGGTSNVFIDRAGRPQYARGSGRRGFAPFSELRGLNFTLSVEVFPEARGLGVDRVIQMMTSGHETLKLSMFERGRKKQPARPLVKPFLDWYATEGLRLFIESQIQRQPRGRAR